MSVKSFLKEFYVAKMSKNKEVDIGEMSKINVICLMLVILPTTDFGWNTLL